MVISQIGTSKEPGHLSGLAVIHQSGLFPNEGVRESAGRAPIHRGGLSGPQDFLDRHGRTADPKGGSALPCYRDSG